MEMEQLAQLLRDLKSLEEALKALQLAKALNAKGKLDGELCEGLGSLAEFAELYRRLLAGRAAGYKPGSGLGMKGPGQGEGGRAPEKETDTDFKPEQSRSALQAGKILMKWKTHGLSDSGEAKEEYQDSLTKVKQGVSEAILHEQVPPGYHESIKKYFDTMEKKDDKKPSK